MGNPAFRGAHQTENQRGTKVVSPLSFCVWTSVLYVCEKPSLRKVSKEKEGKPQMEAFCFISPSKSEVGEGAILIHQQGISHAMCTMERAFPLPPPSNVCCQWYTAKHLSRNLSNMGGGDAVNTHLKSFDLKLFKNTEDIPDTLIRNTLNLNPFHTQSEIF